ncbi:MAG: VCBS repeat-containing protein [Pirellulales bacterium]|nr:VCBS repeat-containing protein [Pirellulales bacterium]
MAGLFQVLWGKPDGTFRAAEELKGTDGQPLVIPLGPGEDAWIDCICTRPTAIDWDADGHLDLVVGNFTGTFYLFKGEGKGRFLPKGELIETDDGPLKISGHHSDPFVVDWDNDGDLDVLSGSSEGGVQWAENVAGRGAAPKLKPFQSLIEKAETREYGRVLAEADLTGPVMSTRIWVDDLNGDGKLDILVGDLVTLVAPAKGLSEAELKEKYAAWQKEWDAAVAKLNAATDAAAKQAANQRVQDLWPERNKFLQEEMTGFVWLYLQK